MRNSMPLKVLFRRGRAWSFLGGRVCRWGTVAALAAWGVLFAVALGQTQVIEFRMDLKDVGAPVALSKRPDHSRQVTQAEQQLYGKTYADEPLGKRLQRLESSLSLPVKPVLSESRIERIQQRLHHSPKESASLEYLETRVFGQPDPNSPLTARVRRLELAFFGRQFDHLPMAARIRKLTYATPIEGKGIRILETERQQASPIIQPLQ
jgi:hypothetical protein